MLIDGNLVFDPQGTGTPPVGTPITASAVSTNVIDLLNGRDLGIGDGPSLKVCVNVLTGFVGSGVTLNIQFQGAPETAVGSGIPGTYTTYAETGVLATAVLTQNAQLAAFDVPRPAPGTGTLPPRFLRLNYVVANGSFSAGGVFSAIVIDRQDYVNYAPGIVVAN